jgi:molybdate transport system regulatory protein
MASRRPDPAGANAARAAGTAGEGPRGHAISLHGLVWMTVDGANLGGPGRVSLLRAIRDTGSITHAARAMAMSYKAAWDAVDLMNRLAGEPLVVRRPGGRGGGSTQLTARGERLIERFDEVARLHRRFVDTLSAASGGLREPLEAFRFEPSHGTLNRLPGRVASVRRRAAADEVELALPNGGAIYAALAPGSTGNGSQLREGGPAVAVFAAASVIVSIGGATDAVSARNRLAGVVERIRPHGFEAEVVLALPGGESVAASISDDGLRRLALVAGSPATALFEAASVRLLRQEDSTSPGGQAPDRPASARRSARPGRLRG